MMVGRQMQLACARVPLINQSVEEKTGRSHKSSNRHHHIDDQNLDKSKSFDTLILFWCSESDIPAQSTGSFTMIRCTKTHMQPLSSSLHRMITQVYRSSSTTTEYKSKKTFLPPQSAGISRTFHFPFSNLGRWDTV